MDYMDIYKQWCSDPYFDADTKAELEAIKDDKAEIEDRFSARVWNRWLKRGDRSRNKPYEYLYRSSGDTGTGKLYHFPERTGKGSSDRARFPYHVN